MFVVVDLLWEMLLTCVVEGVVMRVSRSLLRLLTRPGVTCHPSMFKMRSAPGMNVIYGGNVRFVSHSLVVCQELKSMSGDVSESESSESDGESSSSDSSSDNEDGIPSLTYVEDGHELEAGENPTQYRDRAIDEFGRSYGTGKRKTAIARVWIKPGVGQFIVNKRNITEYFPSTMARYHVLEPFIHTETSGMFDVYSTVKGGGRTGQAGALRLGIARAIEAFEPSFKPVLKQSMSIVQLR